eukprot:GILK01011266.1.p1 GENE.GILK01011266.1~~GILK01011266.1.p1  ORF type:complete len:300 (+),score=19.19 GILK01011266.1:45-902(+)
MALSRVDLETVWEVQAYFSAFLAYAMTLSAIALAYGGYVHRQYIFNARNVYSPAHSWLRTWKNPILKSRHEKVVSLFYHIAWLIVWLHYVTESSTLYLICEAGRVAVCKYVIHHICTAILLFSIMADRLHNVLTWMAMTSHSFMHVFNYVIEYPTLSILFCRWYFLACTVASLTFLAGCFWARGAIENAEERVKILAIVGVTSLFLIINNARTPELTGMCTWPAEEEHPENFWNTPNVTPTFIPLELFAHPLAIGCVVLCVWRFTGRARKAKSEDGEAKIAVTWV